MSRLLAIALALLPAATGDPWPFAYPGSRPLLEREVAGREITIRWRCYATRDPLNEVAAHYQRDPRLKPGTWRMGKDEHGFQPRDDPRIHIAIFRSDDLPQHSQCKASLELGERTVLQLSRASPAPAHCRLPTDDRRGTAGR